MLDHRRRPKPAFEALRAACRPVIVVADRPPHHVHPGDRLSLDVHVVNDLHIALSDIVVHAHLSYGEQFADRAEGEDRRAWSWQGDIGADVCERVGTIELEVPVPTPPADAVHGSSSAAEGSSVRPLELELELEGPDLHVTTTYGTWVVAGPHQH